MVIMAEDDLTKQADEIEALSSIYGDEWCVVDPVNRVYSIEVKDTLAICLQVTLTPGYPSTCPPIYQLSAPWLRGENRQKIQNDLEEIYIENVGENIIYQWVERIREIIGELSPTDVEKDSEDAAEFSLDESELSHYYTQEKDINDIPMPEIYTSGDTIIDRKSVFQGHLAPIKYREQVKMVLDKLCENKKIATATHNITAFRIRQECATGSNPTFMSGCEDDGETHAGSRLLHLLQIVDAYDVLVIVTRWYGGAHLGPDRFKHINNAARMMLVEHGYIKEKEDKKKKGKGTKK